MLQHSLVAESMTANCQRRTIPNPAALVPLTSRGRWIFIIRVSSGPSLGTRVLLRLFFGWRDGSIQVGILTVPFSLASGSPWVPRSWAGRVSSGPSLGFLEFPSHGVPWDSQSSPGSGYDMQRGAGGIESVFGIFEIFCRRDTDAACHPTAHNQDRKILTRGIP